MDDCEMRSEIEPWNVSVIIKGCETMRAGSVHIVEVQCVNVVIGVHIVVLCVLLVDVRVVPIFLVVIL